MTRQQILFNDSSNINKSLDDNCPNQQEQDNNRLAPLSFRARPKRLNDFVGLANILKKHPFLSQQNFPSLILYGPPGCGKTSLARLLADESQKDIYFFNAVLGGVNDLKKIINEALEIKSMMKRESVIFIDEIHRFNKAQQDALLPYVEEGAFTLIGATTENPRTALNKALISRIQLVQLLSLDEQGIITIIKRACKDYDLALEEDMMQLIGDLSGGDARTALNALEIIENKPERTISYEELKEMLLKDARDYDKNKDRHYDVISAFIKSMRGSAPDAAILWLAVMLDGGEEPAFIARRLVIFASEDVGNADPQALTLAVATLHAVEKIGMPEARINLAQCVTYLSSTQKSNASYLAINEALSYVRSQKTLEVPSYLKSRPAKEDKQSYKYPHNHQNHFVKQDYTVNKIPSFYRPTKQGIEAKIFERLRNLWSTLKD